MDAVNRPAAAVRAEQIFQAQLHRLRSRTDRMFAWLMAAQWAFGVLCAALIAPRNWEGARSAVHVHLWAAFVVGGLIASLPAYLAFKRPGEKATRHVIATAQMLTSALLIHLTGGRIETHFHVFGSLAFLAFYRDWPVLVTATATIVADHAARGFLWPVSVYGVARIQPWRFIEHAGWMLFEIAFLIDSIRQSLAELRATSARQAQLEATNEVFERRVEERTRQLEHALGLAKTAELTIERERLQTKFLDNVSHELRTPIASIKGYAETLRLGGLHDTENRDEFLATIEKNADRLAKLVENLLDVTRLENKAIVPRPAAVDLDACLRGLRDDFVPRLRAKALSIAVETDGASALVDPDHLWQILQNLLTNAVKFSPNGGRIRLSAAAGHEVVEISLSDEGPGIPESELDLIFDRFQTHSRGVANAGGTGLGLAIARSLVELNGGSIRAMSRFGRGSTFLVALPLAAGSRSTQPRPGLMPAVS